MRQRKEIVREVVDGEVMVVEIIRPFYRRLLIYDSVLGSEFPCPTADF